MSEKCKCDIFDLDGTLLDTGEGIMNSVTFALKQLGLPVPDRQRLREFVGPPVREGFLRYGLPREQLGQAMELCVGRYSTVEKWAARPYPGMETLLHQLLAEGHRLYVATSKPETLAVEILEKFGLAPFFTDICGADWSVSRDTKDAVLRHLLGRIPEGAQMVMVGDTVFDITGAAAHGIPAIGVAWGYGDLEEMRSAGAVAIAADTRALFGLLKESRG